jgi:hypothetical protein
LKELLENRDLADLANTSEEEPLFSTTMVLLVGETGAMGTAEAEIVAEAAAALVEDIFISKKDTGFGFGKKLKENAHQSTLLKSSAAVPNIVMSFARSSTAWIKHALFHPYNASKRYRSVLGLLQVSQQRKKYSKTYV